MPSRLVGLPCCSEALFPILDNKSDISDRGTGP
ncbi:unnamed protein product [Larinioides sclopetarius]|uniref:Uncharacterized protein n=1 Tax=Larinioides sclopetarius TaxID=280406 RepID=A0AAV2AL65_9ARAC